MESIKNNVNKGSCTTTTESPIYIGHSQPLEETTPKPTKPAPGPVRTPSCHNTCHLTLRFGKEMSLHSYNEALDTFMTEVALCVGVHISRLRYGGGWFRYCSKTKKPWPHFHLALQTPKSRKTGLSVTKLPRESIQKLRTLWASLSNGGTMVIEPISKNTEGLENYIVGRKNLRLPGQQYFTVASAN